jgi:REP element-mobilizing transposase RayT
MRWLFNNNLNQDYLILLNANIISMANTYTQIHIQAVFVVQNRACLINPEWKNHLYSYMSGIIQQQNHKALIINGMPDHIHVFFGLNPAQSLSELMQDIKAGSSKWINDSGLTKTRFSWQKGYGAFSYSKSQIERVYNYIQNQEEHHRKKTFNEEYHTLLKEQQVDFDPRYLFQPI